MRRAPALPAWCEAASTLRKGPAVTKREVIHLRPMNRRAKIGLAVVLICTVLGAAVAVLTKSRRSEARRDPRGWNTHAIESTLNGIQVREIDHAHAAVILVYDLDNRTNSDYTLEKGPSVAVMSRLKPSGVLSADPQVSVDSSTFLPAGNRTRIALEIDTPFNWPPRRDRAADHSFRQLVAAELEGVNGFVLFDQTKRYQIELPTVLPFDRVGPASAEN